MAKKHSDGSVDAVEYLEQTFGPLTFGRCIRAVRTRDGITQVALAARLGVSKQYLSDIENDRRSVSVERAVAWATLLDDSIPLFAELAMQAQAQAAGLPFRVRLEPLAPARKKSPAKTRAA